MSEPIGAKKLAIVVGGGPAPGINGVISAATIEAHNRGMGVVGIQDGYKWLVKGNVDKIRTLRVDDVSRIFNKGGSILGTSRTNPAGIDKELGRDRLPEVLDCFRRLGVTHLVSIGGDDTAFSANKVYKSSKGSLRVAHVPKTIDNDIPLPGWTPTFGFETARHLGTQLAVAMGEDAKTTSRWYVVVSMGRAAGHLALGIGKAAASHLTIIPEEFSDRPMPVYAPDTLKEDRDGQIRFEEIVDIILGSIMKRRAAGKEYGMVVLAEGLLESIGIKWLRQSMAALAGQLEYNATNHYGTIDKDEHGHLRLGEIEFGRMVKDAMKVYGKPFNIKTTFVDKDLGYELRCADPISFDVEYTRNLGYSAVKYLCSDAAGRDGALISFCQGKMEPLQFDEIFAKQDRLPTRRVEVNGESYEVARHYMYRLERPDFEDAAALAPIAECAGQSADKFRERFGYLVGLGKSPWA